MPASQPVEATTNGYTGTLPDTRLMMQIAWSTPQASNLKCLRVVLLRTQDRLASLCALQGQ